MPLSAKNFDFMQVTYIVHIPHSFHHPIGQEAMDIVYKKVQYTRKENYYRQ